MFISFCWKIIRTTSTGGLKLIYSRKEGHMLINPQTPDGIKKLWETNSIITKYLKSKIG